MLTTLGSDLDALDKDLLDAFKWILAQISLVQTNTMNSVLTANPITVITRFIPEDIIFLLYWWCSAVHYIQKSQFSSLFVSLLALLWQDSDCNPSTANPREAQILHYSHIAAKPKETHPATTTMHHQQITQVLNDWILSPQLHQLTQNPIFHALHPQSIIVNFSLWVCDRPSTIGCA